MSDDVSYVASFQQPESTYAELRESQLEARELWGRVMGETTAASGSWTIPRRLRARKEKFGTFSQLLQLTGNDTVPRRGSGRPEQVELRGYEGTEDASRISC